MGGYFLSFIQPSKRQKLLPSSSESLVLSEGWAEHLLPLPVGSAAAVGRSLTLGKESNPRKVHKSRPGKNLPSKSKLKSFTKASSNPLSPAYSQLFKSHDAALGLGCSAL